MNLIYFYDFETNGFPLWSKPSSDPGQPHIVQAAAVLVDADTRETVSSFDLIARPDEWDIPDDVAEVHGVTTEKAIRVGVDERNIAMMLMEFHWRANLRIGHNQPFDARIMRIALKRFSDEQEADSWKDGDAYCTQRAATPICKLPPTEKMKAAGRHHHKTANLAEAYEHFTGELLEDAHTAMGDVLATMAVYWAIQDLEQPESAPEPKTTTPEGSGGDGVGFL